MAGKPQNGRSHRLTQKEINARRITIQRSRLAELEAAVAERDQLRNDLTELRDCATIRTVESMRDHIRQLRELIHVIHQSYNPGMPPFDIEGR